MQPRPQPAVLDVVKASLFTTTMRLLPRILLVSLLMSLLLALRAHR